MVYQSVMDGSREAKDSRLLSTGNVVFLSLTAAAMIATSMVSIPLVLPLFAVLPGVGALATAFFFGAFLAVAYRRVRRPGVALYCSLLMGLLFVFISPSILAYIIASALVTDALSVLVLRRGVGRRGLVLLSTVYASGNYAFGFYFGSLFNDLGFGFHHLENQPWLVLALFIGAAVLGAAGGAVGATIAVELEQRS